MGTLERQKRIDRKVLKEQIAYAIKLGMNVKFNGRRVTAVEEANNNTWNVFVAGRKAPLEATSDDAFFDPNGWPTLPMERVREIEEVEVIREMEWRAYKADYTRQSALRRIDDVIEHLKWVLRDVERERARVAAGYDTDYAGAEIVNRVAGLPGNCSLGFVVKYIAEAREAEEAVQRENASPLAQT